MKGIIVDDELSARLILKQVAINVPNLDIVADFENALQALKYLNKNVVDVIFLDIHMPDFTGFDFIESLKNPPKVVLTTSDRNFALEAFEYKIVVDYLLKPIELNRFEKAIEKVKTINLVEDVTRTKIKNEPKVKANETDDTLYVNIDRRLVKIDLSSICVIEAKGDYIKIITENKNYIVHSSLKKIEEKLPHEMFLKVHRSYVINIKKIIDIEDNSVLINKDVIPVSRVNRNELKRRLNLL
ncbi:LytTR family DNA-binding domain-containing protein [uncultured Polaribacter sp.]|uniref:LytR/AlgR family response regulator transcription factor n=1 Tax=uncultured Polaribacter sp. TaxID=174711 RepID=UPI002611805C|nr:LytTR family DNA-binding domain-containing protein [uncultured Polaribacter sp.]